MQNSYSCYSNWKLINLDNTYETEVKFMCGDVISQEEFVDYIEKYGDIHVMDKLNIVDILSDGCSAGDFLDLQKIEKKAPSFSYGNEYSEK